MPSISIRDIEFIKPQKTLYDAFRYVFAFLSDFQFEQFMKSVKISIDNIAVPQKGIDAACRSLCPTDIICVSCSQNCSDFVIDISRCDYTHYSISYTVLEKENYESEVTLFRLSNYLVANSSVSMYRYDDMSDAALKFLLDELNNDIQRYHREDVIDGFTDILPTTHLIDLCQKYNYIELLMVILRLTKDKDKPKLDLRL